MYLKSLSLKGFKSFADPTVLELEPGVTVVVGPNGSGKSNVVDAVAWVLGAQGPRVVRSQKMDDVIFAGTAERAALGRAEVSLTIDNSSRKLPIDFNEVTITRTLFRTGESEYQLNGSVCRLLDIQELLSDTGVGRQQHVIIGQGQLDAILTARPEDRRAVIEEAAGVLKYRRRRERAERRLEASEVALSRLNDLLREVRRQLKPLERQASSALRHEQIALEADALRLYLTGQELRELTDRLRSLQQEIATLDGESTTQTDRLDHLDSLLRSLQGEFDQHRGGDLSPLVSRYVQLAERSRGISALVSERRRARAELVSVIDDADSLVALEDERHRVNRDLGATEEEALALSPQWEALAAQEQSHAEAEAEHVERFGITDTDEANRELSDARAELANLRDELARRREQYATATERHAQLNARIAEERANRDGLVATLDEQNAKRVIDEGEIAALMTAAERAEGQLAEHESALRRREELAYATAARQSAIEEALEDQRAKSGLERLAGRAGVLGTLFDLVTVPDGAARAFEAALEGLFDSIVVEGEVAARAALSYLRTGGARASVIAARSDRRATPPLEVPAGTSLLRSVVSGSTLAVDAVLDAVIGDVLVVNNGIDAAINLALSFPDRTFVTTDGDRLSSFGWRVGAASLGATRTALDEARRLAADAQAGLDEALAQVAASRVDAKTRRDDATRRALEFDALCKAIHRDDEALSLVGGRLSGLFAELERVGGDGGDQQREIENIERRANEVNEHLRALEDDEAIKLGRRSEALTARRVLEERARSLGSLRRDLEVRAAALEERRSLLLSRKASLEEQIASRGQAQERAEVRRSSHATEDLALSRLGAATERIVARLEAELSTLTAEQQRRQAASEERLERLSSLRRDRDGLERSLSSVRERHQRCELEETELRVRHEAAVDRLRRELDVEPEQALSATLPELADAVEPAARLRELERELRLLGPVNPLAREELAALEERHTFLEAQLEDVRTARRELNQVIHAVDAEIVDVFAQAYADVERHFIDLIATLFPGGSGRLALTAPDDLLNTGVEIEARPAGRNVRRLSLLSGGERSLVAVAFLFAVFRSRPSPFYILDEVEAALDEVNLLRFLDLVEEFRDEAQLIIVSHQKRTMEVADMLYGITMQPGGASKAVSEMLDSAKRRAPTATDVATAFNLAASSEPNPPVIATGSERNEQT